MIPQLRLRGHATPVLLGMAAALSIPVSLAASSAAAGQGAGPPGLRPALAAGDSHVRFGQRVRFRGFAASAQAGVPVTLEYAPRGAAFRPVRRTVTGARGRYTVSARPERSGTFRTVESDGGHSRATRVTVLARLAGSAPQHVLSGRTATVRGRLVPSRSGRPVSVQVRGRDGWQSVDRVRTGAGGRFVATWRPGRPGTYAVRARFAGDGRNAAASGLLGARVNVYRAGVASWYGPGLYGNRLGCGGRLTPGTLGVAHKSLPCGTRVTFRYRGRSVTVPVVDRGPYVGGREWDLTAAAKRTLGFGSTGTVWSTR